MSDATQAGRMNEMLAKIEAFRASLPPEGRARIEAEERIEQRGSWVRAMAPCEHDDPDWETCPQCLERIYSKEKAA